MNLIEREPTEEELRNAVKWMKTLRQPEQPSFLIFCDYCQEVHLVDAKSPSACLESFKKFNFKKL